MECMCMVCMLVLVLVPCKGSSGALNLGDPGCPLQPGDAAVALPHCRLCRLPS